MDKTYQPHQIESHWYKIWEESGFFAPSGEGDAYSIVIPPPNVTGRLHMGHGLQNALMDALIRYHRMLGNNTLWQVGTDHAGIATQMVVERQLGRINKTRQELGREAFVDKVWEWKEESGNIITQQIRRLGSSIDWSRERFTMDDDFSKVVEKVFVELYDEGLIYRGNRLVNWDPKLHTAVSDLEVLSEEEDGFLWHFRYPLADGATTRKGDAYITIATTRPETLLGDTAVAVNPNDERYQDLIGQFVELPLCGRRIPIIADDYVDAAFGTGCVKITPAHDFNDYEVGKRHNLEMINILTPDAAINDNAPEAYRGMDRFDARKKVVADIEALGLLAKIDPHKLKVPRGDRTGVIIEPYLTNQWYVAVQSLAEPAIKAVEDGDIEFVPKNWENTYFAWMRDLQDWCISRQLWWGHRIPAYYDSEGKIYVGYSEADVRSKYKLADDLALTRDEDVLDTWFSSALWTFGTLGWPNNSEEMKTFHPTSVLVTGFDIIFFWVARMIMMTMKFTGQVPFKTVYIHGLVRDENGQKMSKSKGNILDPIDIIDGIGVDELVRKRTSDLMQPQLEQKIAKTTRASFPDGITAYGTDALRFTFYSLASTGRDIKFDLNRTEGFRNFCNKIWNASRYVLMNSEEKGIVFHQAKQDALRERDYFSLADRWIMSRFQRTVQQAHEHMAVYRFDLLSQVIYDFFWNEYCDWYLELTKPVLWDEENHPDHAQTTRLTLISVLEASLRLTHPLMPFITEEIWQRVAPLLDMKMEGDNVSLMNQRYPQVDESLINVKAEADIDWVKGIILGIRNIRGEMDIAPGKAIPVLLKNCSAEDQRRLDENRLFLMKLAKLADITSLAASAAAPMAATQLYGEIEILVPLAGLIDKAAEAARLEKEIAKLEKNLAGITGKLSNAKFVDNAPKEIVDVERERMRANEAAIASLREKLVMIQALD
ncbi:MAG: valine--tRNA ligase [Gammaproteobacteria bacterium]|nr:valine--tRNA ligase [Gammaproteobacteria bacterium]MDP2346926.1 valine--tRNA ligase [Gammaproteobacteria bacterium]